MRGKRTASRAGAYQARRGTPPPPEFFETRRPVAGARAIGVSLGTLRLEIEGLDDRRAEELLRRYAPFSGPATRDGEALRVTLRLENRDYYLEPPSRPELNPVFLGFDPGRVRLLGYKLAGWFDTRGGQGEVVLASGTYEPDLRSIENYVRAAVAWQAARRGGALVHAASAVWQDRAYLFYGASGAGKSTLAGCNRRGRIMSDDLSLVLPGPGDGLQLVGSPFRGTYEGGPPVTGVFPLAAGFRLIQADAAEVRHVPRVRALAELVANLPFVAEAFGKNPDLFAAVEASFASIPLAHLRFRRDDSFWDAIARAGL